MDAAIFRVLAENPPLFAAVAGALGLLVGSFLNVVIHRLPRMMEAEWSAQCAELRGEEPTQSEPLNLMKPRSRCPQCGHAISALENIPILSYLVQKGRCKGCGKPISVRYPLVEAATGGLCAFAAWYFGFGIGALGGMVLLCSLIALTFIDFDTQYLPDSITLPLLWIGLLLNISGTYIDLKSAVIGAMLGYLVLWAVYWGFKLATGKEGMGYGDFKLLAALGAWFGWQQLPAIILLSSAVGACIGVGLIVFAKHGRNVPIPFGPYLAGAGVIALFWGKAITQSWLQFPL